MSLKFDFGTLGKPFEADWPVTTNVPVDGGKTEAREFWVRFKSIDEEQRIDLAMRDVKALLREAVAKVYTGEAPTSSAASPETFEQMLAATHVRSAMLDSYGSFCRGVAVKN